MDLVLISILLREEKGKKKKLVTANVTVCYHPFSLLLRKNGRMREKELGEKGKRVVEADDTSATARGGITPGKLRQKLCKKMFSGKQSELSSPYLKLK